jgi:hypothetical protein
LIEALLNIESLLSYYLLVSFFKLKELNSFRMNDYFGEMLTADAQRLAIFDPSSHIY